MTILPDACISDLEALATIGKATITDLQGTNILQIAESIPTLYCAVASAATTCPFLSDINLPLD